MKKRVTLFFIDFGISLFTFFILVIFSSMDMSSLILNGKLNSIKILSFSLLVLSFRLAFGIYRHLWRYSSVKSYLLLTLSDGLSGIIFYFVGYFFKPIFLGFSYTFIFTIMNLLFTLLSRFIYRFLYEYNHRKKGYVKKSENQIKVAVVGAGSKGSFLVNNLYKNKKNNYLPVCYIDNNKEKSGGILDGIPVFYEDSNIIKKLKKLDVKEIIIAIQELSPEKKEKIFNFYSKEDFKIIVPSNIMEEGKKITLREIRIEDLLFRDSINIENKETKEYYSGKKVLVTGGGGSIGSEICRQIAKLKPKKLVILDIYENNAYEIEQELRRKYGEKIDLEVIIASVRDKERLDDVFEEISPDIVIHAAAHKHVPLMEKNGVEAIKNNVFGTYNVANACEEYGVEKMILISTDKAVNPTNIMGATKRLCEMIIQCRRNSETDFCAVRFGNVLGSNGSVIPLFKKQIEEGGPVTITDKRIIRYFMTIPEAVSLVMEAGAMARCGELFVLDMGKPVKILNLAENMIRLAGLIPNKDIKIKEIGLRKGEKLWEELLMKKEELDVTSSKLIFIERDKPLSREEVEEKVDVLRDLLSNIKNIEKDDLYSQIIKTIKNIVPTYKRPEEVNERAEKSKEMQLVEQ